MRKTQVFNLFSSKQTQKRTRGTVFFLQYPSFFIRLCLNATASFCLLCKLFYNVKKHKHAKNDSHDAIYLKKRAENPENNSKNRNRSKHSKKHAYYCANYYEDNKLNKEWGKIFSFDFKWCRPIFFEKIHSISLLSKYFRLLYTIFVQK